MLKDNYILMETGRFLYIGDAPNTEVHRHHAVQIGISLDIPFGMRVANGGWQKCKAIIVGSDCDHECTAEMQRVLFISIDPESPMGISLSDFYLKECSVKPLDTQKVEIYLKDLDQNPQDIMRATDRFLQNLMPASYNSSGFRNIDPRIQKAIDILKETSAEKMSVSQLAKRVCLSEGRLVHLFKERMGLPVRKYRLWLRMIASIEYFFHEATLTDSAHQAGFTDSAQFSRTFKRMFGISPSGILKNSQKVQVYTSIKR